MFEKPSNYLGRLVKQSRAPISRHSALGAERGPHEMASVQPASQVLPYDSSKAVELQNSVSPVMAHQDRSHEDVPAHRKIDSTVKMSFVGVKSTYDSHQKRANPPSSIVAIKALPSKTTQTSSNSADLSSVQAQKNIDGPEIVAAKKSSQTAEPLKNSSNIQLNSAFEKPASTELPNKDRPDSVSPTYLPTAIKYVSKESSSGGRSFENTHSFPKDQTKGKPKSTQDIGKISEKLDLQKPPQKEPVPADRVTLRQVTPPEAKSINSVSNRGIPKKGGGVHIGTVNVTVSAPLESPTPAPIVNKIEKPTSRKLPELNRTYQRRF